MKRACSIYETLMPIYYVSKIFGIAPYVCKRQNGYRYVISKLGTWHQIVYLTVYLAFFAYANINHKTKTVNELSKIANFLDTYQWGSTVLAVALLIASNGCYQKMYIRAVNHLGSLDEEMSKFGFQLKHPSQLKISGGTAQKVSSSTINGFVTVLVTQQVLLYLVMESINCTLFLEISTVTFEICHTLCVIPLLTFAFLKVQFTMILMVLTHRFKLINEKLSDSGGQLEIVNIEKMRRLHDQYCSVARSINKTFSVFLCFYILHNFIGFTALAYYCIEWYLILTYLKPGEINGHLITSAIWALIKAGTLLHLTYLCNKTKIEANSTAVIIHKIKNRFDYGLRDQIVQFSKQILHSDVKFTAFDLTEIDLRLFINMTKSAATYLLILIQMDLAIQHNRK